MTAEVRSPRPKAEVFRRLKYASLCSSCQCGTLRSTTLQWQPQWPSRFDLWQAWLVLALGVVLNARTWMKHAWDLYLIQCPFSTSFVPDPGPLSIHLNIFMVHNLTYLCAEGQVAPAPQLQHLQLHPLQLDCSRLMSK